MPDRFASRPLTLLALAVLVATACRGAEDVAHDPVADSLAELGFAESMETIARQEQPCLTSDGEIPRAWTTARVPEIAATLRLPPRFEQRAGMTPGSISFVNPDSAELLIVPPNASDEPGVAGMSVEGLRERPCALPIAGRLTRVMELRRQRPARADSVFSVVGLAYPNDSATFAITISAPTRASREELQRALTTLTLGGTP